MAKTVQMNSAQQFDSYLSNTEYVVVDFHATWCGPCHMISPVFEKLADQHSAAGKIAFVKVDVDNQQEIAMKYGITAMPTFLVIKNSKVTQNIRGANPPALNAAIQNVVKAVAAESPRETLTQETVSGSYGMTKGSNWKMALN